MKNKITLALLLILALVAANMVLPSFSVAGSTYTPGDPDSLTGGFGDPEGDPGDDDGGDPDSLTGGFGDGNSVESLPLDRGVLEAMALIGVPIVLL